MKKLNAYALVYDCGFPGIDGKVGENYTGRLAIYPTKAKAKWEAKKGLKVVKVTIQNSK